MPLTQPSEMVHLSDLPLQELPPSTPPLAEQVRSKQPSELLELVHNLRNSDTRNYDVLLRRSNWLDYESVELPSEEERKTRLGQIWDSLRAFHRITEELEIDYFVATVSLSGRKLRTCADVEVVFNGRHKVKFADHLMREKYYGQFQLSTLPGNGASATPASRQDLKEGRTDRRFMRDHWFGDVINSVSYDCLMGETHHPYFGMNNLKSDMPSSVLSFAAYSTEGWIPDPEKPTQAWKANVVNGVFFIPWQLSLPYKLSHIAMNKWWSRGTDKDRDACDMIACQDFVDFCRMMELKEFDYGDLLYTITNKDIRERRLKYGIDPRVHKVFDAVCKHQKMVAAAAQGKLALEPDPEEDWIGESYGMIDTPQRPDTFDMYHRNNYGKPHLMKRHKTYEALKDPVRAAFEKEQYNKVREMQEIRISQQEDYKKTLEPYEKDGRWPFISLNWWDRLKLKMVFQHFRKFPEPHMDRDPPKFKR